MLSACVVISVSFALVQTAPLNYNDVFFPNYDSTDYNEMVRATRNLISSSGPEPISLKEANSVPNAASVYPESNDIVRMPSLPSDDVPIVDSLPQSSYFKHGIKAALPLEYGLNNLNVSPLTVWNNKYLWSPYGTVRDIYQADHGSDMGSMNPYEVDLYPFIHTSLSGALNPVPPVHTLPPVYATHIHERIPSLDTRGDFDIDVLNPENSELLPPNLRITRSGRDYMDDLAHDAMMNNILPTMSVPFVRGAENNPAYQIPVQTAVYPTNHMSNCGLPILLNCNPNVIRGSLSNTYAEQSPPVESSGPYRQGLEQI